MIKQLKVNSSSRVEFLDITSRIKETVLESGIENGLAVIKVPHTTAGITINESADPDVKRDIISHLKELVPRNNNYRHREGNSDAHIKSTLVGSGEMVIIKGGTISLGRWQGIFFCEFDGPRTRKVNIKCISD